MERNQGDSADAPRARRERLARQLAASGYTADTLFQLLGARSLDDIGLLNHPAAFERLRDDGSAAALLTRLFFLEADESTRSVARVLGKPTRALLHTSRLVAERRGLLRARARIDPVGDHWILSDLRFRAPDHGALGLPTGDSVYPPGADSLLLRQVITQREGASVVDLCTGSGVQALSVAHRASHVIAVDVNARATAMVEANALLNRVTNVEARLGNLYRPVTGLRFDTVIANPPFVPSPYRSGPRYHSGGPTGGRLLHRIIAGLGTALRADGRFFAVSHLALRGRESVGTVLRPWFKDFHGRALALVLEKGSAIDLAAAQALFALSDGLTAYGSELRRWVAHLHRHRIREIVLLLLVAELSGRRQFDVVEALQRTLPLPLSHPPEHHVQQWLATHRRP